MNAGTGRNRGEAAVHEVLDSWLRAARAKDVDAVVSHYADDIVAFDAMLQLQFKGVDAYRRHWAACLQMCPGPTGFELHELTVRSSDDVAFAHGLLRCGQVTKEGEERACWMRLTSCLRKTGGRWAIVHEHFSAPFDIESGNAMLELQP